VDDLLDFKSTDVILLQLVALVVERLLCNHVFAHCYTRHDIKGGITKAITS